MNYYCTNSDQIEFITTDFSKANYITVLADTRNIPLDNAVLLDVQIYDNREIDCWKLIKTKENQSSAYVKAISGLIVNGIKIKTTESSITALNELLSLAGLENNSKALVEFRDYNDDYKSVTYEQFKSMLLEVGKYCRGIDKAYTTNIKAIESATTIEELKAIVI